MEGLQFHDTYLEAVDIVAGTLLMDAVVYRDLPDGTMTMGMQLVRLTLRGLTLIGEVEPLPFDIYRDTLRVRGNEYHDLLPIPSYFEGPIELIFSCREDGREICIEGTSLNCEAAGDFKPNI